MMDKYDSLLKIAEEVGMASKNLKYIDDVMERAIREKVMKGMVTLVARHGKIVQFKAYGKADDDKPMKRDAIFRLASMSKTIGGVALMQLFDQGKVMMSDPITDYLPDFKEMKVYDESAPGQLVPADREITIHDLLTMTSGIVSIQSAETGHPGCVYCAHKYREAGVIDTMHPLDKTLAEVVDQIASLPLASQPGQRWEYSNLTSLVAGRIVEIVSGMDLQSYLDQYIFRPLGMKETCFFPDQAEWSRIPAVYACATMERLKDLDVPGTDTTRLAFADCRKYYNIAAGLHGTVYDYFRFAQMLCNKGELDGQRILSPNAIHLMTQNHIGSQRTRLYGHGWGYMMNVQVDYNTVFNYMGTGSYGWHGYWGSVYNVWPEKDLVAIMISQVSPVGPSWKIQERFLNVAAGAVICD